MNPNKVRQETSVSTFYTYLFFAFFPLAVFSRTMGTGAVNFVLVSTLMIALVHFRHPLNIRKEEKSLIIGSLLIFVYTVAAGYVLQMETSSRYVNSIEYQLIFLLPLLLVYTNRSGWLARDFETFKTAIAVAAITAGLAAGYDMYTGIADRYERLHGQPIVYGDLSMLFGLASLVFWISEPGGSRKKTLYAVAFILGAIASLYSGSRGGWIGLPMVLWLFWKWKIIDARTIGRFLLVAGMMSLVVILIDNPVKSRILEGAHDLALYRDGQICTSLGGRFEMWKIAWYGFLENPLFGIGLGEYYGYKLQMMHSWNLPDCIERFKSPHNEYLNILVSFGLIGTLLYGWLILWLWNYFSKLSADAEKMILGRTGQLTIVAYLDFALSEVMLSAKLGGAVFMVMCTLLIIYSRAPETSRMQGKATV